MLRSFSRWLLAAFVAVLLAACGGGTDGDPPSDPEPDVGPGPTGRTATLSVSGGGDRVESPRHRAHFFVGTPAVSPVAPAAAYSMGFGPAHAAQPVNPPNQETE